jgi:hypothetical protein
MTYNTAQPLQGESSSDHAVPATAMYNVRQLN